MKTETFHLELITPCFCGGAQPDQQAEIRSSAIRGQLRWWFRTLGGFKSLAPMPVSEQETMIFGSTADNHPRAGQLIVRGRPPEGRDARESARHPQPNMNEPEGYLLFPLRQQVRMKSQLPSFRLTVLWRGEVRLWSDLRSLLGVFGQLGALGFRGRRAMGALAFSSDPPDLAKDLDRFSNPRNVSVKELNRPDPMPKDQCVPALANWLKSWRQHGRTPQLALDQPGFDYARRDHNEGVKRLSGHIAAGDPSGHAARGREGVTFRPALGLPIIQFFSSAPRGTPNKVNWEWSWRADIRKAHGRFASPVLLRPHRDAQGNWHALVIFVDSHKWPVGKQVFLNGQARDVSLELYEAMKNDPRLRRFL
jgi:hypothetical protein